MLDGVKQVEYKTVQSFNDLLLSGVGVRLIYEIVSRTSFLPLFLNTKVNIHKAHVAIIMQTKHTTKAVKRTFLLKRNT